MNKVVFVTLATALVTTLASSQDNAPLIKYENAAIPDSYVVILKNTLEADKVESHYNWVKSHRLVKRDQVVFDLKMKDTKDEARTEIPRIQRNLPLVPFAIPSSIERVFQAVERVMMGAFREAEHLSKHIVEEVEELVGLKHEYNIEHFRGYSGRFSKDMIEQIRSHPDVELVEEDSIVSINYSMMKHKKNETEVLTQLDAPWNLARLSHKDKLDFGTFKRYDYREEAGEGVTAYVIDTGVDVHHPEFEGRAKWGKTIPTGDADEDGNGHGTHCAGTIGSRSYGVAKKAHIVAVKVLRSNGSGSMSDVLKGVEYAAAEHKKAMADAKKHNKPFKGSTANMSLGGGKSQALDRIVNAAVKAGMHFAVAAGNDDSDACDYSPAAAENAVTVGASTLADERAFFSNKGKCVDVFAGGLNILSTWPGKKTNTISGTSMASPGICGLLTYLLSLEPVTKGFSEPLAPKTLKKRLLDMANQGKLTKLGEGSPNLLAYNGL